MANSNTLREIVEPKIRETFLLKNQIKPISRKSLLDTKPDVIGEKNNELYIGEITVSGYNGYKSGNFHIGATRKLADSFMKLFILKNKQVDIERELNKKFIKIHICFIYPENSKFMNSLGYRNHIFDLGLEKYPIAIDASTEKEIQKALTKSQIEVGKK